MNENDIALGHNPAKLTNAQVGTAEGWRLLESVEVREISLRTLDAIECWIGLEWIIGGYYGNGEVNTYRTKLTSAKLRKARGLEPEQPVYQCPHPMTERCQRGCEIYCRKCWKLMHKIDVHGNVVEPEQTSLEKLSNRPFPLNASPLLGDWRHSSRFVFCGTLRIFRIDVDTNSSPEWLQKVMEWVCKQLNEASSKEAKYALIDKEIARLISELQSLAAKNKF